MRHTPFSLNFLKVTILNPHLKTLLLYNNTFEPLLRQKHLESSNGAQKDTRYHQTIELDLWEYRQ